MSGSRSGPATASPWPRRHAARRAVEPLLSVGPLVSAKTAKASGGTTFERDFSIDLAVEGSGSFSSVSFPQERASAALRLGVLFFVVVVFIGLEVGQFFHAQEVGRLVGEDDVPAFGTHRADVLALAVAVGRFHQG